MNTRLKGWADACLCGDGFRTLSSVLTYRRYTRLRRVDLSIIPCAFEFWELYIEKFVYISNVRKEANLPRDMARSYHGREFNMDALYFLD